MKRLLILISILSLSACQSMNFYQGPTKPNSEVAELFVTTQNDMRLSLVRINEQSESFFYKKRLYLLPDTYELVLHTGRYSSREGSLYGRFVIKAPLKAGKTYTFRSSQQGNSYMNENSRLCIYEEDQNDPDAQANWTNEFRSPSVNAINISCALVQINRF